MRVYCLVYEFVLLGIAESSTIYVTCDLVPLSAHVREQVHNWRYMILPPTPTLTPILGYFDL